MPTNRFIRGHGLHFPGDRVIRISLSFVCAVAALAAAPALANSEGRPSHSESLALGWETVSRPAPAADFQQTGALGPAKAAKIPAIKKPAASSASHALTGIASYYWQDQMTASGERFNKNDMTAAHKTLPLGSRVRVTNLKNGRETIVRINDRGPYIEGRVIDLSEAAAKVLGFTDQGLTDVKVELVGN